MLQKNHIERVFEDLIFCEYLKSQNINNNQLFVQLNECILRVIDNETTVASMYKLAVSKHIKNYKRMSKQQLISVLWEEENTKKCKKQVLNKSTVPVAQTETCSEEVDQLNAFPTCTVFRSEDTLPVESELQSIQVVQHSIDAIETEQPVVETLTTACVSVQQPDDQNMRCSICLLHIRDSHCSLKHMYCEVHRKYSDERQENTVFDPYYNEWLLVSPSCSKKHYDDINEKRHNIRAFTLFDKHDMVTINT